MNTNNFTKTNDNNVEVGIGYLSVYGQPMFKGYEGFVNQSQEQIKNTQKKYK
ncbi:hypothetical protein CNO14_07240 (plasmid) [Borrelia miyamotoi]|uniref:BppA n=2 Tax=Borrelia miyamotoi TaxID=47466 RepID=A0AAQ3CNT3_9SPIR|nr:hypothetical protein [Borrelia miyamotoi]AHH05854.1 Hypothetical protein BOM_1311 [Borrelia miyamotoi FR64b]WAZ71096.1 hypothetical protein O5403_05450 [Borrelia miyamotoi]WCB91060.1 hypothetical protein CNO11_07410 [Borrelia miyamotoi]WCL22190.1 hypothetical protein CNO10_07410 [Borrelia miyamotoi]WDE70451.1 hypothetical protein CNO12_07605 [Borrelia miyamotoi]